MKKVFTICLFLFLFISQISIAQSYLGTVKKRTNLRELPNANSSILSTLNPGSQIFIISLETINGFYNIIDIETDIEGYVAESQVKVGEIVERTKERVFSPSGEISSYNPKVEIFNNTVLTLTLKLNESIFKFDPHETKTITLNPGYYDFRASASGVVPVSGGENLISNMGYRWEFYVLTERR